MSQKPIDKALSHLLADLDAETIARPKTAAKTARFEMRLSDGELAEMKTVSGKLGLSVTEYLLELHRHAMKRLLG